MLPMNDESAILAAVDIAKVLCESNGSCLSFDADSANKVADFIETLEHRLIDTENQPDK